MPHHALLYRADSVTKENIQPLVDGLNASQIEYLILSDFKIDDVRNLTNLAYLTPSQGDRLGIVVIVESITVEAEQALLKLLEEPPLTTVFLFCIPASVFILPTLLSRFNEIKDETNRVLTASFVEFAALSLADRLAVIAKKITSKDNNWLVSMKQGMIAYLAKPKAGLAAGDMACLYYVVEHLLTRGASNKQLLEELALTLPLSELEEGDTLY